MKVNTLGDTTEFIGEVENTLEAMQNFVEGYIECVPLTNEIDIICDECGKIKGTNDNQESIDIHYNRVWLNDAGNIIDFFVGNIMCVRHTSDGEFASIMNSDIPVIKKYLKPISFRLGQVFFLACEE